MNEQLPSSRTSRRAFVGAGVAAASYAVAHRAPAQPAGAQAPEPTAEHAFGVRPLDTLGLEHIGTVVPDVTRSALFYSRVFSPALYRDRDKPLHHTPERPHFRCPGGLGVELLLVDPARIWGLA